jgi:hypothetical protein
MDTLKELFDIVLVDVSVQKFMDTPWDTMHELMVKDKSSVMITEQMARFANDSDKEEVQFDVKSSSIIAPSDTKYEEPIYETLKKKTNAYLETKFDEVKRKDWEDVCKEFPTMSPLSLNGEFIVAKSPK